MTAADEQLVAELAEALRALPITHGAVWPMARRDIAAVLLPVVLADRRRAVAEALREAADNYSRNKPGFTMWLRARTDAVETGDGR